MEFLFIFATPTSENNKTGHASIYKQKQSLISLVFESSTLSIELRSLSLPNRSLYLLENFKYKMILQSRRFYRNFTQMIDILWYLISHKLYEETKLIFRNTLSISKSDPYINIVTVYSSQIISRPIIAPEFFYLLNTQFIILNNMKSRSMEIVTNC